MARFIIDLTPFHLIAQEGECPRVRQAGLGDHVARIGAVVAKLGAEFRDEDAQVMGVVDVRRSPKLAKQLRLRKDLATVAQQQREQRPFLPRERDRLADLYRHPEARREIAERLAQEKALTWVAEHATKAAPSHQT